MDEVQGNRLRVRTLEAAAIAGLLALASHTVLGVGKPGLSDLFDQWLYDALMLGAAAACLARAALVREQRLAWSLIGLGVLAWALAEVYWSFYLADLRHPPFPSLADAGYLAFYPLTMAGLALLLARGVHRRSRVVWVDAAIAALAVTALSVGFLARVLPEQVGGTSLETAVAAAYPLGDVLMIAFVGAMLALTGWHPTRVLALIAAGLAVTALADAAYLWQEVTGSYVEGGWVDVLWPLSALLIAFAAWQPRRDTEEPLPRESWGALIPPLAMAAGVLALQLLPSDDPSRLGHLISLGLIVAVALRVAATFYDNHRLTQELKTDALTGLGNRGKLLVDLRHALHAGEGAPHTLAIFDLDGFKLYNDTFGHPAGDAMLTRLAERFAAALEGGGTAYRLGGDEFGALMCGRSGEALSAVVAASAALSEKGEGFSVTSSYGVAEVPGEARAVSNAMQLADQRMYAQKDARRLSAGRQAKEVLLSTLRAREPELGRHVDLVTRLAVAVGRELGLEPGELSSLARAAELHDIGKMAIPDAILNKPEKLTEEEWEFMHQHTILGERILRSAPSLAPLAAAVRSSHERWDGTGYPDGLRGEEIPVMARVILVCDAFHAMTSERPYAAARSPEEAIAELQRCAGTQFDPAVAEAFGRIAARGFPSVEPAEPAEALEVGRTIEEQVAAWAADLAPPGEDRLA